jgi:hypothetical protein
MSKIEELYKLAEEAYINMMNQAVNVHMTNNQKDFDKEFKEYMRLAAIEASLGQQIIAENSNNSLFSKIRKQVKKQDNKSYFGKKKGFN